MKTSLRIDIVRCASCKQVFTPVKRVDVVLRDGKKFHGPCYDRKEKEFINAG